MAATETDLDRNDRRGAENMGMAGMDHKCSDCNDQPGPGSVVRLVGKDSSGKVIVLCSRCFIRRERDAAMPAGPQLKVKKAKGRAKQ